MTNPTTASLIVDSLIANGIDTLYCLPGVQNDVFFDSVHHAGNAIRPVHTRHEQATAYMALGAALASGEPQAYCVVPGPGILNTTAALSTAYAVSARVLALTGQIPAGLIGKGTGQLHEIPDQLGIMERLSKWAGHIGSGGEARAKVEETFAQLVNGAPSPVALEVPLDVWGADAGAGPTMEAHEPALPLPDPEAIARAAKLLGAAENPMIVVGGGAQGASEEVRALAELLQAPVVAFRTGLGVLDARHYLSHTMPAGHRLWESADVVLALGTRLQMPQQNWGTDDALKIIHVSLDETAIGRVGPAEVGITADASRTVTALLDAVPAHNRKRESREPEMMALKADMMARYRLDLGPQLAWIDAIRAELPEDGIMVEELTQISYVSRFAFPVYKPRTFLSSGYQGTLGWGYPAALGAKIAMPDRTVLSVSGDGGFLFNAQELSTAVHHRIPVTAIVFADGAYGNVRRIQQEDYGGRTIASDLTNPDFVQLAESYGAKAMRVREPDELRGALQEGFGHDGPSLIEVPVGEFPAPWDYYRLPRIRGQE